MTTHSNQSHEALSDAERREILRNLLIYTVGVMTLSVVGGILVSSGAEVGALVFLVGPILMAVLLAALAETAGKMPVFGWVRCPGTSLSC